MTLHEQEIQESVKYQVAEAAIDKKKTIALLTRDNIAKIEAIIKLDSRYRNTADPERKPIKKKNKDEFSYIGSTCYWVKRLQSLMGETNSSENESEYASIIEFLIKAIDNENSTHLNSDGVGREAVKERLIAAYGTPAQLIEALKNKDGKYTLLNLIATPENEKNHFSFATKFCHYCAMFLFAGSEDEDMYSIYDDVLKNALPLYIKYYLDKTVKPDELKTDYTKYIAYIDEVRNTARDEDGYIISRNGFDHLVWYYHKGR